MKLRKNTKMINEVSLINHRLKELSQEIPPQIRISFFNSFGKFNAAYNLLAGYQDRIYFYQNDPIDRDRVSISSLEKESSGLIYPFAIVKKEIWLFEYQPDQIQRITKTTDREEVLEKIKLNFNAKDVFLKSSIFIYKKDFFKQDFLEIISFPLPQKLYTQSQERISPRALIPEKLNTQLKTHPPTPSKNSVTDSLSADPQTKAEVSRFWTFVMNRDRSISSVLMEFFDQIPQATFSPYFNIEQFLKPKPKMFENYESKVRTNYSSFEKIKELLVKSKKPIFSPHRLIIPLIIYSEVEGHFVFSEAEKQQYLYFSKMIEVIANKLLTHPMFRIDSQNGTQSLMDISYKGLRFRSDAPAHRRLQRGSRFTCEFNLHWTSSLSITIQVAVIRSIMEKNDDGSETYDIACAYLIKDTENNKTSFTRIKKFVDDHVKYSFF